MNSVEDSLLSRRIRLGVNIDHVATLRQARGTIYPDPLEAMRCAEKAGADCITIHLREDRRHIQDSDVYAMRGLLSTRLNLEMACNDDVLAVALDVRPHEACLVPERRAELTTEGGLDVAGQRKSVERVVRELRSADIVVSLFIDPDDAQIDAALEVGATVIELHTGTYCDLAGTDRDRELARLHRAAERAARVGLTVNAGHGLTLDNVAPITALPALDTLNIGHSIVCRALFVGIESAVREMRSRIDASLQSLTS